MPPSALPVPAPRWAQFRAAVLGGDEAEVQALIARTTEGAAERALQWAARRGNLEDVVALMRVANASADDSFALVCAAELGHTEVVRVLLPASDPQAELSRALGEAAKNGHTDAVAMLAPVSDPWAGNAGALRCAAENGHAVVVGILIDACKARTTQAMREPEPPYLTLAKREIDGVNALCAAAHPGNGEVVGLMAAWIGTRLAWKHMEENGLWEGLDALAPHAAPELVRRTLGGAPAWAMPHTRSRLLSQELTAALPTANQSADTPRFRL